MISSLGIVQHNLIVKHYREPKGEGTNPSFSKHHRKPQSLGGSDVIVVPHNFHVHWHAMFENYSPEIICALINQYWLDSDYIMSVKRKEQK
jgi:hypothetical protein